MTQIETLTEQRQTLLTVDRSEIYRGNTRQDVKAFMDGLQKQCDVSIYTCNSGEPRREGDRMGRGGEGVWHIDRSEIYRGNTRKDIK